METPLAEPSPQALDELMAMDPLQLTKDDAAVDRIIAELRAQRERWEKTERKKAPKAQVVTTISLEDLGFKV